MTTPHAIHRITLDEGTIIARSPEVEHERATAIADLLRENHFHPSDDQGAPLFDGPYNVHMSILESRLHWSIRQKDGDQMVEILLPVKSLRSVVKDYFMIVDSYYKAIQSGNNPQVEAIDMGRRGIHNEGAEQLVDLLRGKITTDFSTARRLFTLVCVLHIR